MVTLPIWSQIDASTIKSVADIFRDSRYEGDQHRKSRLSGLAMNKIGGGTRGDGRLPCSSLVLLPEFVGQWRIELSGGPPSERSTVESGWRAEKSVPSTLGVIQPTMFLQSERR